MGVQVFTSIQLCGFFRFDTWSMPNVLMTTMISRIHSENTIANPTKPTRANITAFFTSKLEGVGSGKVNSINPR